MDVFMDQRASAEIPVPERQAWGVENSTAPTRQLFDDGYALCIENRHINFLDFPLPSSVLVIVRSSAPPSRYATSVRASPQRRRTNLVYRGIGRPRTSAGQRNNRTI